VQVAWIPFWAAGVINGLGHFWGYRNFSPKTPAPTSPWGILIGGEELHNNHHTFPTSARLSIRWYEFDIGWLYIRILAALGLAQVKKVAPRPRLGTLRPVVDFDTLQAVIVNRYDVLSQYARSLKQVYREELGTLQDGSRFKGLKRWLAGRCRRVPQEQRGRLELLLGESRALHTLTPCARNWWPSGNARTLRASTCSRRCRTGANAPRTRGSGSCRNCRCACAAMCWPESRPDACAAFAFGLLALAATGLTLAGWWIGELMKLQPCPLCIFQRLLYLLIACSRWPACCFPAGRAWGVLLGLTAAGGVATAAYQSWLQYLPEAAWPAALASRR
jgi:hypothetical protein